MSHATTITFRAGVLPAGNDMRIPVPEGVSASLGGGKRTWVVVSVDPHTDRSAVRSTGFRPMVASSAEHRAAARFRGSLEDDVAMGVDREPRSVQRPADHRAGLVEAGSVDAFEASVPSQKTEGRVRLAQPERAADASRPEAAKHV